MFAAAAVGICLVGQCMATSRMPPALVSDPDSPSNSLASPSAALSNQSVSKMEEGCVPIHCSEDDDRYCCYNPVTSLVGEDGDRVECFPLGEREERVVGSDDPSGETRTSGLDETEFSRSTLRPQHKSNTLLPRPVHGEGVQRIERRLEAVQRRQRSLKRRVSSFRRRLAAKRRGHVEDDVRREIDELLLRERKTETIVEAPPLAVPNMDATVDPLNRQERQRFDMETFQVDLGHRLQRVLDDKKNQRVHASGEASRDEMEASFRNWALQMSRLGRQADEDETESETSATDVESDDESEAWIESKVKTAFRERHQEISTEWRRDCAVLSSRWHWLQQRIADLEQAIRRQTEVCESLKAVKQPFRHEQITEPTPKPQEQQMNNCSLFLFVPSESRLSTDLRPTNGLLLKLSEASKTTNEACHAARTCPLINRPYRRLVHMCTDEVRERGTGEREEVGCYDPAFHHKLSVNTDIPIPLLLETSLRLDRWKLVGRKRKSSTQLGSDRKRSILAKSASQPAMSENVLKGSISAPSTPRSNSVMQDSRLCRTEVKKRYSTDVDSPLSMSMPAGPLSSLLKQQRKRPMSSAYDINNIIIPNSFASTTRVERLQYKNIVTPKWREMSHGEVKKDHQMKGTNGVSLSPSLPEIEDLSDEAFTQRHGRAEEAEHKRFMAWNKIRTPASRHSTTSSTTTSPTTPITPSIQDDEEQSTTHARRVFRRLSSTYDRWQDMLREAEISIVPLFPVRTFPLSEDVYEKMVTEGQAPVEHSFIPSGLISTRAKMYIGASSEHHRSSTAKTPTETLSPGQWDSEESYAPSPLSVADLSDTETEQNQWSVVSLSEKPQETLTGTEDSGTNRSIVIKLTKR